MRLEVGLYGVSIGLIQKAFNIGALSVECALKWVSGACMGFKWVLWGIRVVIMGCIVLGVGVMGGLISL